MTTTGTGKLSILISCYNQRDLIGNAITSFFEQDHENREIIVLDDGSTDDSMAVIAECAKNAPCPVIYATQENHGAAYTFARLAEMASGDYLLFCGGDDFVPPDSLSCRIRMLENSPQLMFVCGMTRYVHGAVPGDWFCPVEHTMKLNTISPEDILHSMKYHTGEKVEGLIFSACIIRRSDYLASGGFSRNMTCDDAVLLYNLLSYGAKNGKKIAAVPDLVFFYRQHENNISKDPEAMWIRFSELYNNLGFPMRKQASFSAYATYMQEVRKSGKWFHKTLLKRIFTDPAVIKYLTIGAICRDLLFPRFGRF